MYTYGFFVLLSRIFFFLISLLFGWMFGIIWESAVFYIMFSALRGYAGGFHAAKESVCTFCTAFSLFFASLTIRILSMAGNMHIPMCILLLCGTVVYLLSPLGSEGKPLSADEYTLYRRKTRIIVFAIIAISIGTLLLHITGLFYAATVSMTLESFVLVLAKVKTNP